MTRTTLLGALALMAACAACVEASPVPEEPSPGVSAIAIAGPELPGVAHSFAVQVGSYAPAIQVERPVSLASPAPCTGPRLTLSCAAREPNRNDAPPQGTPRRRGY